LRLSHHSRVIFSYCVHGSDARRPGNAAFDGMAERHIACGACRHATIRRTSTVGRSQATDAGLDRLQDFLLAMEPGDEVSVVHAQQTSGLDASTCETVLEALLRAGLMLRLQHQAYVRVRLAEAERQTAKSPFNSV
jgi:hypothetical protein